MKAPAVPEGASAKGEAALDSLRSAWMSLDGRRRFIVLAATLAMFAAVLGLSRMGASGGSNALLYAGLEGTAAGEVVAALDQRGVTYEVRGDAIYVAAADRDALRLGLAGEGLPRGGAQGYELLDSLTGFGTTAQMFDAAYWRAKEGELARTILAVPGVQSARVHIAEGSNRPFQRQNRPTAAVTVTMGAATLSGEQARALRFLVAAAVAGMDPANVAIIDGAGNLMVPDDDDRSGQTRAAELQAQAERLLVARVGPGNAVVEVTVDTVTESETVIERQVDPETRVAIATDVQETTASATDQGGEAVTVASNLPDGDAAAGGGSQSQDSETRTVTNFDLSETSREIVRVPGAIRRLTVAVLVNDVITVADDGTRTATPRAEAELAALGDLVATAVGLDTTRGDVITVRSMTFEPIVAPGTEALAAPGLGLGLDLMRIVQLAVLAVVAIILGLFVVRPILTAPPRAIAANPGLALPRPVQDGPGDSVIMPLGADMMVTGGPPSFGAVPALDVDGQSGSIIADAEPVDPVTRLRRLIDERQKETMQILQNWIEDPDEKERV
jgi:flagellar M-ring protein FliF